MSIKINGQDISIEHIQTFCSQNKIVSIIFEDETELKLENILIVCLQIFNAKAIKNPNEFDGAINGHLAGCIHNLNKRG